LIIPSTTGGTTIEATKEYFGGSGDCCFANGSSGCEDSTCQDSVCSYDTFCCDVAWDSICANEAAADPNCDCEATVDLFCGTPVTAPGVWYTVIGTGNTITVSTCNDADYDTKLSVYCTDCDTEFTCVTGEDDTSGCGLTTEISFCSQAGQEYHILVHGFSDATGDFDLTVTDDGVPCLADVLCAPTGACCTVFGCLQTDEPHCTALGGDYKGEGTECITRPVGNQVTYTSSPNLPIPDANPAGISDTITVNASSFAVHDMRVQVEITHTWIGDLKISLEHVATGKTVNLWNRRCGNTDNMNVTFGDGGSILLCSDIPLGTGMVDPLETGSGPPLASFSGLKLAGDWRLLVSDNAGADTGTLVSWSIIATKASDETCSPLPIPTVNRWGLVVMALIILAAGAVMIRRRKAT
ncbi:MAG: IPTL-CTERM sorting domain-containing protein, partial [Deltaproteobacteria bacterium]|nr:IPTL-CTERM sorting domain-containing protein [Deltaproteobacteria bacterium]